MDSRKISIVIPTFRRINLLKDLLLDINKQTVVPHQVIISDGDTSSSLVKKMLLTFQGMVPWTLTYIPSNYANAPYQRYLGFKLAKSSEIVVFIDDDIHLPQSDIFEKVLRPFLWKDRNIVGVSPVINFPNRINENNKRDLTEAQKKNMGGVTPTGNRIVPINTGKDYDEVKWLRGGMMAYSYPSIEKVIYAPDVFAMSRIGCGLGVDDTFLSRCVGVFGELLIANCAQIEHPDLDTSKVYSQDAKHRGFAVAYSRRFLNDHYRITRPPTIGDRLALVKSYVGNSLLNWTRALSSRDKYDFAYARGYSMGALKGIFQKPTARSLTPEIDWWQDAEDAMARAVTIQ